MRRKKKPASFRLTEKTHQLLEKLAESHDTTETQVLEDAIKEKARREKINVEEGVENNG